MTIQEELEQTKQALIRAYADYDNLKKRHELEMKDIEDKIKIKLVRDLLPTLDALESMAKYYGKS